MLSRQNLHQIIPHFHNNLSKNYLFLHAVVAALLLRSLAGYIREEVFCYSCN